MWDYCANSLDVARLRGANYADVRVMHMRQRNLTTKNRQVGTLGQTESIGLGIRVIVNGAPRRRRRHAQGQRRHAL